MTDMSSQKLAFLDTNALVRLFNFWEVCRIAQVSLSSVSDWKSLRQNLAKATTPFALDLKKDDFDLIRIGHACFQQLYNGKGDFDFLCCQVSRSELHNVLLAAKALDELRLRKVPRSLVIKRPLIVYQLALPSNAYSDMENQIDDFFDAMRNEYLIDIKVVEEPANGYPITSEDIFRTAKKIWSHVLMETMDAYIFAAAVEVDADYLITSDIPFRNTVNGLRQGQKEWQDVAYALKAALGANQASSIPIGIGLGTRLT